MSMNAWENDAVQFPRLLAEINATCELSEKDWEALSESTGLELARIEELFERANNAWEAIKDRLAAGQPEAGQVRELGTFRKLLPDGTEEEFVLLREPGANAAFAVSASYVAQDNDVHSPYGNGLLRFDDSKENPASKSSFTHTVIEVHVLSDDPDFKPNEWSLGDLEREMACGDIVGRKRVIDQVSVDAEMMAVKLTSLGSDPDFFQIDSSVDG